MNRVGQPRRFRRRLTAVFVGIAGVSAGLVALLTFVLAREYRWRNLRAAAVEETRFALALAPEELDGQSSERFLAVYERRSDAHILAVGQQAWLSSADFEPSDVPAAMGPLTAEPTLLRADVSGRSMLVSGAAGPGDVDYYVFFSLDQFHDGLEELARAALLAWTGMLVLAAGVGTVVARRTLRPVARAALAAEAIANGDLAARLDGGSGDEFGALARSFNRMADEVQDSIGRANAAAERERRFTADVAHELRTPLTGMSGAAALIANRTEEMSPELRRPVELLALDVQRLGRLVGELLELARLDAATDQPEPSQLEVDAAVRTVIDSADSRRAADIRLDLAPGLVVLAEPAGLKSILANLLDNAIQHGGPNITIRSHLTPDRMVAIVVLDDGPGLDPDRIDDVFGRFHKADASRSNGGAGLGLAIAREQSMRQGGRLYAENRPTGGASFTVELAAASN